MITQDYIMSFVITHTNRTNELRNIAKLLISLVPNINEDSIKHLVRRNQDLGYLFKTFGVGGIIVTSDSLNKLADNIIIYADVQDELLSNYINVITLTNPVMNIKHLTVRESYVLLSLYHYVSYPVIVHKMLQEILMTLWGSLYPDNPLNKLSLAKSLYGEPYYLTDKNKSYELLVSAENTDVNLVTTPSNVKLLENFKRWLEDESFDTFHASQSVSFIEYGRSVKSYIDTKSPSLITQLRIQTDELITNNRHLRRAIHVKR